MTEVIEAGTLTADMTSADMTTAPLALDVPFADVRADDLRLSIGGAVPEALAHVTIAAHPLTEPGGHGGASSLTLGVLGSSHVAFVGDAAAPVHVEELSCTAVGGAPLRDVMGEAADHAPAVSVEVLGEGDFGGVVKQMRRLGDDPSALVAEFPGRDGAITAVRGEAMPGGFRWRTWHLYPQASGGEVVATRSEWRADRDTKREVGR
ncbi:DUF2617 family protein [Corynebacterium sp. NPDC060344]|uniref:DUF2617 family protein n=1 Tax=Corynebacterium sp. NPDC060344 TaxID=3347101 RepID=UPI0036478051